MDVQEFKNKVLSIISKSDGLTQEQKGELSAAVTSIQIGTEAKKITKSKLNL